MITASVEEVLAEAQRSPEQTIRPEMTAISKYEVSDAYLIEILYACYVLHYGQTAWDLEGLDDTRRILPDGNPFCSFSPALLFKWRWQ